MSSCVGGGSPRQRRGARHVVGATLHFVLAVFEWILQYGSAARLLTLAAGVLVFHVVTSMFQEAVFHLPGFSNVLLLSFAQTLGTTVITGAQLVLEQLRWRWRHAPNPSSIDSAPVVIAISSTPNTVKDGYDGRGEAVMTPERCRRWHRGGHVLAPSPTALRNMNARGRSVIIRWWRRVLAVFHLSTVPLRVYFSIALFMSCSLVLTNSTSYLLTYSLQVIFKSSKLLVMVVVRRYFALTDDGVAGQELQQSKSSGDDGDDDAVMKTHLTAVVRTHNNNSFGGDDGAVDGGNGKRGSGAVEKGGRLQLCRRLFRGDGEMISCVLVVCGLIAFTMASTDQMTSPTHQTAGTTDALSAVDTALSFPSAKAAGGVDGTATVVMMHPAPGRPSRGAGEPMRWLMLLGIGGVLLSNVLDALLYVYEERYCFGNQVGEEIASERSEEEDGNIDPDEGAFGACVEDHGATAAEVCTYAQAASGESEMAQADRPSHGGVAHPTRPKACSSLELLFFVDGFATVIYAAALILRGAVGYLRRATSETGLRDDGTKADLHGGTSANGAGASVIGGDEQVFDSYGKFTLLLACASLSNVLGTLLLVRIISEFNSTTAVVVTSVRKTLTVLFSYLIYRRPFTGLHAVGLAGVMGGVAMYESVRRQGRRKRRLNN